MKARLKEKAEMACDLKAVFDNFGDDASKAHALDKLSAFCGKWRKRYPDRFFDEGVREYYCTYIDFPVHLRRILYTTNSIENLNRVIDEEQALLRIAGDAARLCLHRRERL